MASPPVASPEHFVSYMNATVTPFHCVAECARRLRTAGFVELNERDAQWQLTPGGRYYFTRNGTAIVAFAVGAAYDPATSGAVIVGAHTDSPCPKLKPRSTLEKAGHVMLGVVGYGGALFHTWFDRDLTVAGRALVRTRAPTTTDAASSSTSELHDKEVIASRLVRLGKPVCRIPTLAIHLTSAEERSSGFKPNLQQHLPPMLATGVRDALWKTPATPATSSASSSSTPSASGAATERHHPLLVRLIAEHLGVEASDVVDFELQLCDTQPATVGGAADEFVFSGRLDNQACCYLGLESLIQETATQTADKHVKMIALFDHEEVGSCSATGAQGPLLRDALLRVPAALAARDGAAFTDVAAAAFRARSFLVSADMAHAHHPNYAERHDAEHAPKLGRGLVIKHNANQRYATDGPGATLVRRAAALAAENDATPCQEFAVKADSHCGSTIGPISAANLGIRTVDLGPPQLSMHSIREMMHIDDLKHSFHVFAAIFRHFDQLQPGLFVCERITACT